MSNNGTLSLVAPGDSIRADLIARGVLVPNTNAARPSLAADVDEPSAEQPGGTTETTETADVRERARQEIRNRAASGMPELTGTQVGNLFGYGARWGRARIAEVSSSPGAASPVRAAARTENEAARDAASGMQAPATLAPAAASAAPTSPVARHTTTEAARPAPIDVAREAAESRLVRSNRRAAVPVFYLAALIGTAVSGLTSYQFVGEQLRISGFTLLWHHPPLGLAPIVIDLERLAVFAGLEILLIGCAIAMRANVLRSGNAGSARTVAWLVSGFAGFAGLAVSETLTSGIGRIIFGPMLAMTALHLALGLDARSRRMELTGAWAQVAREVRERVLSLLGLGNDERDALARTRDRAALRAATLAIEVQRGPGEGKKAVRAHAKNLMALRAALHVSNVAHDPQARARMVSELATLQHAETLAQAKQPSPW